MINYEIGRIGERAGPMHHAHSHVNIGVQIRRRKHHSRNVSFVEYRTACGRRIGMCGYRLLALKTL